METVKLSIRKNDQVQVIAGREKGKTGKVMCVSTKTGRVTVEKVNMVKRHVRPSQQNPQGGIIEKELPLHYSNILLFCTKCSRGVRHRFKMVDVPANSKRKGAEASTKKIKVRVCKRCDSSIDAA